MKYKKLIIFLTLFVFLLSGCSSSAANEEDEYKSLEEILATERSVENETTTQADTKEDSTKEQAVVSEKEDNTNSTTQKENSSEASTEKTTEKETKSEADTKEATEKESEKETEKKPVSATEEIPLKADKEEETTSTVQPQTTVATNTSGYFFSDTYNMQADSIVFSPRELYYENGMLHATVYIYNGHTTTASDINNVALTFSNDDVIASYVFDRLEGCNIAPGSYVMWNFIFPTSATYTNNADMSNIRTTYQCNYSY